MDSNTPPIVKTTPFEIRDSMSSSGYMGDTLKRVNRAIE